MRPKKGIKVGLLIAIALFTSLATIQQVPNQVSNKKAEKVLVSGAMTAVEYPFKKDGKVITAYGKSIIEAPIKKLITINSLLSDLDKIDKTFQEKSGTVVATAKKEIEAPIKKTIANNSPSGNGNKSYTKALKEIKWERDFEKATAKAKKEGKMVMLFHLLGDLDEEFC